MKTRGKTSRKGLMIGLWIAVAAYAAFGLLQGAAIGGTAGLVMANEIFGTGMIEITGANLITRVLLGGSMLAGALVSLVVFLTAGGAAGWAAGYIAGSTAKESEEMPSDAVGGAR